MEASESEPNKHWPDIFRIRTALHLDNVSNGLLKGC